MSLNSKTSADRAQRILLDLVALPGNNTCADCKARNPRWASYNLGIFLCVNCAAIHRKIGTHITKIKSITIDTWTKEQTEVMQSMGNVKSNAIYNPNELRHPPPPNMEDLERDSELERYIRGKYEYKSFIDKSALVASKLGPSRSASSVPKSTKLTEQPSQRGQTTTKAPKPTSDTRHSMPLTSQQAHLQSQATSADLVSLQTPESSSSLPLQYHPAPQPQLSPQTSFTNTPVYNTGPMQQYSGFGPAWEGQFLQPAPFQQFPNQNLYAQTYPTLSPMMQTTTFPAPIQPQAVPPGYNTAQLPIQYQSQPMNVPFGMHSGVYTGYVTQFPPNAYNGGQFYMPNQ